MAAQEVCLAESRFWLVFTRVVQRDYSKEVKSPPSSLSLSPDPPMLSNRNQLLEREVPKASRWKGRSSWREGGAPPTSSPSPK